MAQAQNNQGRDPKGNNHTGYISEISRINADNCVVFFEPTGLVGHTEAVSESCQKAIASLRASGATLDDSNALIASNQWGDIQRKSAQENRYTVSK